MKLLTKLYAFGGHVAFILLLPFFRLYLRSTHRAYAIIICGREILVIKGWFDGRFWHLPGGGIKTGETSVIAISRELAEEIGLTIKPAALKPLASGVWRTQNLGHHYNILTITLSQKPVIKLKRPEILAASWLSPGELNSSNTPSEILAAVAKLKL